MPRRTESTLDETQGDLNVNVSDDDEPLLQLNVARNASYEHKTVYTYIYIYIYAAVKTAVMSFGQKSAVRYQCQPTKRETSRTLEPLSLLE